MSKSADTFKRSELDKIFLAPERRMSRSSVLKAKSKASDYDVRVMALKQAWVALVRRTYCEHKDAINLSLAVLVAVIGWYFAIVHKLG